ncbi:MAG: hypothetical protein ACK5NK_12440 [Niabella sp.]
MKLIFSVLLLVSLIAFANSLFAQKLDAVALAKIGERLVQAELKNADDGYTIDDRCIRNAEGDFLSCYSAESITDWVTDFNGDGYEDAVFNFLDEGLGGGGNAFGFDYRVVLLDSGHNIINQFIIFGGGKFSYGHLSIDNIENGKIYATYQENLMSRSADEGTDNLKSVSLVFYFDGDKIVEEGYAKCPLSAMKDKKIFKTDSGFKIDKQLEMNDQFNEECREQLQLPDGSYYVAILDGCEDLELYFSHRIEYNPALEKSTIFMKERLLEELVFLKENTIFKTIINNAYVKLKKYNTAQIKVDSNGGTALHFTLPDGWKSHLFLSGNKEQGSFITIRIEKPKYAGQMDFWESMESKKKLK